ncbi:MAG TPA: glycosyltransferase [Phycisphaerae bacterium]|nr:glycosyltransferase [Phycisphaerae bacterium]
MRVHFVGENDDGVSPSTHNARALGSLGVDVRFDPPSPPVGWRSREWEQTCRWADVIHVVTYSQCNWMLLRRLWRAGMHGLPIVRYWVGSDCLWARHHAPSRRFAQALGHLGTLNLAVADHLVEELAQVGVQAATTPVITPNLMLGPCPPPLPDDFAVLCYLPTRRRAFYGGQVIDRLIERMPDVRFIILADAETDYSGRENVESPGYVEDLAATIRRATVHVRPTCHDGMPRLVLEMLSFGRYVIASHPYPGCHQAAQPEEVERILRRLRRLTQLNLSGREWVRQHFETAKAAGLLRDQMQRCLEPGETELRRAGRRQAATLLSRCPWMLSRRCEPLPTPQDLPKEAAALRLALGGEPGLAVSSAEGGPRR